MRFAPPKFPKLPRYRGEADPIHASARVIALEKIDGANTRIGVPQGAQEPEDLSLGGRVLMEDESSFSERAIVDVIRGDEALVARLLALSASRGEDIALYGETCGGRIQRMGFIYGPRPHFLLFGARLGGAWCSYSRPIAGPEGAPPPMTLVKLAEQLGLVLPPLCYEGPPNAQALDALLDRPSQHSLDQGFERRDVDRTQEGVVIWADPLLLDPYGRPLVAKHKHPSRREWRAPDDAQVLGPEEFAERAAPVERLRHAIEHLRAAGKWIDEPEERDRRIVRRAVQDISKEVPEYQAQLSRFGKAKVRAALEVVIRARIAEALASD